MRANLVPIDERKVGAVAEEEGDRPILLLLGKGERVGRVAIIVAHARTRAVLIAVYRSSVEIIRLPVRVDWRTIVWWVGPAGRVAAAIPALGKPGQRRGRAYRILSAGALADGPVELGIPRHARSMLGRSQNDAIPRIQRVRPGHVVGIVPGSDVADRNLEVLLFREANLELGGVADPGGREVADHEHLARVSFDVIGPILIKVEEANVKLLELDRLPRLGALELKEKVDVVRCA